MHLYYIDTSAALRLPRRRRARTGFPEDVVRMAMAEPDPLVRSLDAIHLATVRLLGEELTALLAYDDRLAQAAADAGMPVRAPRDPQPPDR
jgi:predicted nucleic acid-binding protein